MDGVIVTPQRFGGRTLLVDARRIKFVVPNGEIADRIRSRTHPLTHSPEVSLMAPNPSTLLQMRRRFRHIAPVKTTKRRCLHCSTAVTFIVSPRLKPSAHSEYNKIYAKTVNISSNVSCSVIGIISNIR